MMDFRSVIVTQHTVSMPIDFRVDFEKMAQLFHEHYEALAPTVGYETRKESAKPWEDVPEQNKRLMIETCAHVADHLFEFLLVAPRMIVFDANKENN